MVGGSRRADIVPPKCRCTARIARRSLEMRAEERGKIVVEPLVEPGPVKSRRILADHRLEVSYAGWADREKREVLRVRNFRECMRRFQPRVDRLDSFWFNAVTAGFRAPELDRDRDAGEAVGREKHRQWIGKRASVEPAVVGQRFSRKFPRADLLADLVRPSLAKRYPECKVGIGADGDEPGVAAAGGAAEGDAVEMDRGRTR